MKDRLEKVLGTVAGIGGLIALVGMATACVAHHPVAFLIVPIGMLLAAPAAILSTVKELRKSQRKLEHERRTVEKQIAQGQHLSALVPKEVSFSEGQRHFWISWRPLVFILGIALVFGLLGGWTGGGSCLAVGFAA
jgi:hypothetical protein